MSASQQLQLQVNTAGAWKTVVRYDANDPTVAYRVTNGSLNLYRADRSAAWRIATCESYPQVRRELSKRTAGVWRDVER